MKIKHFDIAAALLLVGLPTAASSAIVSSSTFDTDLEGWTVDPVSTLGVSHGTIDGNPGGYVRFEDKAAGRPFIVAPSSYHGDWSSLDGSGALQFDHRFFQFTGAPRNYEAVIEGGAGEMATWLGPLTSGALSWTTVIVPINEDLRIRIEVSSQIPDIEGIDNVIVSGVVPLPPTLPLFCAGLGLMGFFGWCRRRRVAAAV